ncbi:MAG: sugar ABC transporter permease [Bifidobacteriaceae bacterium]|nr:sugar ABC transporter permease [Bifidobacteriaceae bacterium]
MTERVAPKKRRRDLARYLYIAPATLYVLMFAVVPMVRGVWLGFTDTKLTNPSGGRFIGLDNYTSLLGSEAFWNSIRTTILYTLVTVIGTLVLGTSAALALNRAFAGRALLRGLLTFPYAMPTIAAVLVFIWIYNPSSGLFNRVGRVLGIGEAGWLTDPEYGLASVLIATIWKVFPIVMLIVLAALQSVPEELREAARVDGADALSSFRGIVLPHIMPTLRIVALLMTIWSIRRFEIIYLLTGGGPVETTNTVVVSIYRRAFSDLDLSTAAALGVFGLLLSFIVTVAFFIIETRETRKEASS